MMKTLFKNLVWMALPLGLVMGCAENPPASEASYGPAPDVVLQPTSAEPEQRIYRESDATVGSQNVTVSAVPAGASPQTWALAEEIRQKIDVRYDSGTDGQRVDRERGERRRGDLEGHCQQHGRTTAGV